MRPHRAASRRLRRQPRPRPNTGRRWLAQLRRPGPRPRHLIPSRTTTQTHIARPEPRFSGGNVTTAISGVRGAGALPRRVLGVGPVAMMKNILVVEDEPEIARVIRDYLHAAGFMVSVAADGESALQSARTSRPDLVVLDLGLPGRDGLDVTRELRRTSDVPIVVVTARGDEADRIVGLELGADDYVVKPFSPKELVARVRALFRRVDGRDEPGDVIRVADLEIDIPRMRVTVDGRAVELTASEFQLLAAMAREPGRVFTRGQLLDVLHGVAFESYERAIDAHVKNLRRKIEPEQGETRYVQTVYGVGYRFAG
jgi:two-component system, OmpR family, alkaline phosphatase synthesis response regulator PhoP